MGSVRKEKVIRKSIAPSCKREKAEESLPAVRGTTRICRTEDELPASMHAHWCQEGNVHERMLDQKMVGVEIHVTRFKRSGTPRWFKRAYEKNEVSSRGDGGQKNEKKRRRPES